LCIEGKESRHILDQHWLRRSSYCRKRKTRVQYLTLTCTAIQTHAHCKPLQTVFDLITTLISFYELYMYTSQCK